MENNVLSHVFTPGRLELLRILASQAAISIENARLAREEADRASALTEMQLARDVQLSILPRVPEDPAYRLSAFMQPAAQVGGDYYDFVRKNTMRWFAIGDVAGHGLYSGLVMLMAQTGFGMYLKSRDNPDLLELYTTLNAQLHDNVVQRTGKDVYMTLTVFCADESGLVRYTGKHQDLLVYRAQTETIEVHNTEGVWLGILPDIAATAEASTIQLNPGDMLILYSDGVLECRNASGEQFDTARLMAAIQQYAPDGPEAVQSGIRKACFDFLDKQDDDLTVMVIQKK
ncbi:MAG: PP2C family protein-serine/threonine phosphatase, partial [Leptospiraceae bacterium]|nr:PP2C family protein-serine/threonine phosphatase [Leptospiraceae bacterium]